MVIFSSYQYQQRQRIWPAVLPILIVIFCVLGAADGKAALNDVSLDLKILVISSGNADEDIGLDLIDDVLNEMGVPYAILDASRETLTAARLSTQQRGHYNGIILTNSELYVSGSGSGFTLQEWQILHAYERDFSVRESVLSGFPATNDAQDLDYGMTNIKSDINFSASWLSPAGGPEYFEYVNTKKSLDFEGFAFFAQPRADGTGPTVQPLLVDQMDTNRTLISLLSYPDGREVLLSTITNAWYFIHSNVLAYEFVNFATKGLFIGARQVFLSTHMDDIFLANDLWNTGTNATDASLSYRLTAADILNARNQVKQFRNRHSTVKRFDLDLAFNGQGVGSRGNSPSLVERITPVFPLSNLAELDRAQQRLWMMPPPIPLPPIPILSPLPTPAPLVLPPRNNTVFDGLTTSIVNFKKDFRFISHTFTHRTMNVSNGVGYPESVFEISENRKTWNTLKLPKKSENNSILVTGNHSGLLEDNNTEFDTSDDTPYPDGINTAFMQAAQDLGVRFLASDASQVNQAAEQRVPGFDIILLPRWPSNVYFNTTTANELTDEYNYVFYERHINAGQDPCMIPGAICAPRSFQEIMRAEADIAVRHMISYRMWPHFFHQTNMRNYDGRGNTLIFHWLSAVVGEYEKYMTLPIENLEYFDIAKKSESRVGYRDVTIEGVWDVTRNIVTLSAAQPVNDVFVTGIKGGKLYGGQRLIEVDLSTQSKEMVVDRALSR